ncbi:hypothetical protein [Paenibacillus illinoisensis]|uniref:hypothetical protein n=1 Tax=Paenibacillus illinoisensis TaxID=59845 RepID=UPI0015E87D9C|nr:hypothetical protein [Paenibacillus illinoisensis]
MKLVLHKNEECSTDLEKRSARLYNRIFTLIKEMRKSGDNSDRKMVMQSEFLSVTV